MPVAGMGIGEVGERSRVWLLPRLWRSRGVGRCRDSPLPLALVRLEGRLIPGPLDLLRFRTVDGSSDGRPPTVRGVLKLMRSSGDMGTGEVGDRLA